MLGARVQTMTVSVLASCHSSGTDSVSAAQCLTGWQQLLLHAAANVLPSSSAQDALLTPEGSADDVKPYAINLE